MKKTARIIIVIIVVLLALRLVKDQIIRAAVSAAAGSVTGTRVSIGGLSFGVFQESIRIKNLRMYNPEGFSPNGILVDLPNIFVEYDLRSLLKGKLHLRRVEVVLSEIGLEKDKAGKLNVDSLKLVKEKGQEKNKSAKQMPMQIDLLNVQMGRVVLKDYSNVKEPLVEVYDINLKKTYRNITGAQQLAALLLSEPLKQAGIKGAAIYGIASLAGTAILPVAIAVTLTGKDFVRADLNVSLTRAYEASRSLLGRIGKITKENKDSAVISAQAEGSDIDLALKEISPKVSQITISARKYMIPKPEIAGGILYQITEELKSK